MVVDNVNYNCNAVFTLCIQADCRLLFISPLQDHAGSTVETGRISCKLFLMPLSAVYNVIIVILINNNNNNDNKQE